MSDRCGFRDANCRLSVENISFISEPVEVYRRRLTAADTLPKLIELLEDFMLVAWDGLEVACGMTPKSFATFRTHLLQERRGQFSGEASQKTVAPILLPETMFKISMVAEEFKVPWGCAFIRLKEVGRMTIKDGRAVVDLERKLQ